LSYHKNVGILSLLGGLLRERGKERACEAEFLPFRAVRGYIRYAGMSMIMEYLIPLWTNEPGTNAVAVANA